jgi:hypothetical protein
MRSESGNASLGAVLDEASAARRGALRIVVDCTAHTERAGPKIRATGQRWTSETSEQDRATDPRESPRGEAEGDGIDV